MNELSPTQQMWQFLWPAIGIAQALHVAAELRIADVVAKGPRTPDELAEATRTHEPSLRRLLCALASLGVFAEDATGRFGNTPLSERLRSDHPESVRAWAVMLGAAFVWRPWGELGAAVGTGEPAFDAVYGTSLFEHFAKHRDDAAVFDAAMTAGSSIGAVPLLAAYDFSSFERIVDVGGGQGALLHGILSANPAVRGILYDLPAVITGAGALRAGPIADRCEVVGGSFFDRVPAGSDGYVLKNVIHDWNDEDAVRILKNCRRAIRRDGRLLLIEGVLRPANEPDPLKFLDLMMLVLVRGRERTESEFRTLLREAGFSLTRVIPTAGGSAIIENRPI